MDLSPQNWVQIHTRFYVFIGSSESTANPDFSVTKMDYFPKQHFNSIKDKVNVDKTNRSQ